jgi:hypothetical protein
LSLRVDRVRSFLFFFLFRSVRPSVVRPIITFRTAIVLHNAPSPTPCPVLAQIALGRRRHASLLLSSVPGRRGNSESPDLAFPAHVTNKATTTDPFLPHGASHRGAARSLLFRSGARQAKQPHLPRLLSPAVVVAGDDPAAVPTDTTGPVGPPLSGHRTKVKASSAHRVSVMRICFCPPPAAAVVKLFVGRARRRCRRRRHCEAPIDASPWHVAGAFFSPKSAPAASCFR